MSSKKRIIGINKFGIIYASIIILLNIVGIGYGNWRSDIKVESTITTGSIDPIFSQYGIEDNSSCEEIEEIEEVELLDTAIYEEEDAYCEELGNVESTSVEIYEIEANNYSTEPACEEFEDVELYGAEEKKQSQKYVNKASTSVEISEDGKKMYIYINDAYPGYSADVRYTVVNQGTIPVYCKVSSRSEGPFEIDIEQPEGIIDGYGDSKDGTVCIRVGKVKKMANYSFSMDLMFKQYNISE